MTREKSKKVIALEARLKDCKNVITLGVRPNFCDYSPKEAGMIRDARKIYYPTTFYAELFDAMGKETFPSYHTYKCVQDKIKDVLRNRVETDGCTNCNIASEIIGRRDAPIGMHNLFSYNHHSNIAVRRYIFLNVCHDCQTAV